MSTRIMIAEDEPLMRERLLDMLAQAWPEAQVVLVAENGNDAWDGDEVRVLAASRSH